VIPFNDPERATRSSTSTAASSRASSSTRCRTASVSCPPTRSSSAACADWTEADGSLLAFDEVITFRSEFGGAQQWFDVAPDLTATGQGDRRRLPGRRDRRPCCGDGRDEPARRQGSVPALGHVLGQPDHGHGGPGRDGALRRSRRAPLNELAARAMRGIEDAIARTGVPASVTGAGSAFRVHMKAEAREGR
jgi:glutamate-1-semialdehyde 2,1-aminomutase